MNSKTTIDIFQIKNKLWAKKKLFLIVWSIVFVLSCIWIFPQPRYYNCSVSLAPETPADNLGGMSSIASSFGINLGGTSSDAIYPLLYPELMQSPDFLVGLFDIKITTEDGSVSTDYYTYLRKHQKKNWLTEPFMKLKRTVKKWFAEPKKSTAKAGDKIDPFFLSKENYDVMKVIGGKITCSIDQKTEVITISVSDQDRLVCALLADSVRQHLQDFMTSYRTSKARLDVKHYQKLTTKAKKDYEEAMAKYSAYCDANQDIILQSTISERDNLESDMQQKFNTYNAMFTQLEAMKAKLQEKTPAFTTLQSATVPQLPAGPKRILFIAFMLIISTLVTSCVILKQEMRSMLVFYKQDTK